MPMLVLPAALLTGASGGRWSGAWSGGANMDALRPLGLAADPTLRLPARAGSVVAACIAARPVIAWRIR